MPQNAVDIENLSHRYGETVALDRIDLSVKHDVLFGLLGPNGGGKTTLFRILATLLMPERGRAHVLGVDVVRNPRSVRRQIGIVFQDPALDEELTVVENLRTHATLYGLSRSHVTARLADLLPLFGLDGRENERVGRLSGGLKRRVDLVRGLIHTPPLLLLDEPTSGLDPAARRAFWETIDRLRRHERITLLVATHVMEEADRCDRLGILDQGRLVALGTPEELKDAVGEETLWIESEDPVELARGVRTRLNVAANVIGARVQISDPHAHGLLSVLYDTFGDEILSATVRRPNLEDVFMVHAGRRLEEHQLEVEAS